jgi:HSP20 family protein
VGNLTRIHNPYRYFDRHFDDVALSPWNWRFFNGEALTPLLDVHQTDDEVVVTVSLPGIKPEDVNITLTGRTLVISGELKADETVEREQYVYRERRVGTFSRQLQLPVRVVGDKAEANFENGLLRLSLPKAEESKPHSIEIKVPKAQA